MYFSVSLSGIRRGAGSLFFLGGGAFTLMADERVVDNPLELSVDGAEFFGCPAFHEFHHGRVYPKQKALVGIFFRRHVSYTASRC